MDPSPPSVDAPASNDPVKVDDSAAPKVNPPEKNDEKPAESAEDPTKKDETPKNFVVDGKENTVNGGQIEIEKIRR